MIACTGGLAEEGLNRLHALVGLQEEGYNDSMQQRQLYRMSFPYCNRCLAAECGSVHCTSSALIFRTNTEAWLPHAHC